MQDKALEKLLSGASALQEVAHRLDVPTMLIGGMVVIRWGQPRTTNDVDATVLTGFDRDDEVMDELLRVFRSRISDPKKFFQTSRMLLLKTESGVPLDVSLGGYPLECEMISRSTPYEYQPGVVLNTCGPEDLISLKAFADRDQDWADVQRILQRQGKKLDKDLIEDSLAQLCATRNDYTPLERLKKLIASELNSS